MKNRLLAIILSITLSCSSLAGSTAYAQEIESEQNVVQTTEDAEETNDLQSEQQYEEELEQEGSEESNINEQELQENTNQYVIGFKELRGEDKTWVFQNESDYSLEAVTEGVSEEENAEFLWSVRIKDSDVELAEGFEISEDGKSLLVDGCELYDGGYQDKTFIVRAELRINGESTEKFCETELTVREAKVNFTTKRKTTREITESWSYTDKIKLTLEDQNYPTKTSKNLKISKISSSDSSIVSVSSKTVTDEPTKKKWTMKAKKLGKVTLTYKMYDGENYYTLKHSVTVKCSHKKFLKEAEVEALLNQAKSWLGRTEKTGGHKEIINIYNAHKPLPVGYKVQYYDAWCATFVSAAAIKTNLTNRIPKECGCGRMIDLLIDQVIWEEDESKTPEPGWIIFYDWQDSGVGNNKGWSEHVGIVEKVSGSTITVIEGNYSESVKRRTVKVNGRYIRGYGVPLYGLDITKASIGTDGVIKDLCATCSYSEDETIAAVEKVYLSDTKYTYDGKVKPLKVTVKDSKGKTVSSKHYKLTGDTYGVSVGKHTVTVKFNGCYYEGKKELSYVIQPKAPTSVKAELYQDYDDVKISWQKSIGAKGYNIYYRKSTDEKYTELASTKNTSYIKRNLTDGKKYDFKIVPYYEVDGKVKESTRSSTASVYTLKKVKLSEVKKYASGKVNVSWRDVSGVSGYQVSQSRISLTISAVSRTARTYSVVEAKRNRTYYYRVRAYKTVDGKRVYGPWSDAKKYSLK